MCVCARAHLRVGFAGEVGELARALLDHVGARVNVATVDDGLAQLGDVPRGDGLGVGERRREVQRHADLVRAWLWLGLWLGLGFRVQGSGFRVWG